MAIVIGQVNLPSHTNVAGDRLEVVADITLDASYPTGGYTLAPATLGLGTELDFIDIGAFMISTTVYQPFFNYATNKIQVTTGAAEVSNATDLHLGVLRVYARGKGFPTFSNI